jgi:hypothetical protein
MFDGLTLNQSNLLKEAAVLIFMIDRISLIAEVMQFIKTKNRFVT